MADTAAGPAASITLEAVIDEAILKKFWQRMRKRMRKVRVYDFYLAHDALEWLPFDYDLDAELQRLRRDVLSGHYRPSPVETVRGCKSLGLSRPLAFFAPRDALLYRSIIAAAENDLLRRTQPFVRFGRSDSSGQDSENTHDSGWFRDWLRRQGHLWTLTQTHEWLVVTDISNFFPSIHIQAAMDHLLAHSRLDMAVVRLLSHSLREFSPQMGYRVSPIGGLPQDNIDCSRILAHSYLNPVDEAFALHGESLQFSRWMDDIVVGAESRREAQDHIAKIQVELEHLGLYPNTAKTRVIKSADFALELMKEVNDELGAVDDALKAKRYVSIQQFRALLATHLQLTPRPRAWERVLRRFYGLARRLECPDLLDLSSEHLELYPGTSANILDYLSTWPLEEHRTKLLRESVEQAPTSYQDVSILCLEYLATAPNGGSGDGTREALQWAQNVQALEQAHPRARASALIVLGKFGALDLVEDMWRESDLDHSEVAKLQATLILLGAGRVDLSEVTSHLRAGPGNMAAVAFITALTTGESKAVAMCLAEMKPRERRDPRIYVIPPRLMFMSELLRRCSPTRYDSLSAGWNNLLLTNRTSHRDLAGEQWLLGSEAYPRDLHRQSRETA